MVIVTIAGKKFRLVMDTGASRDVIRTKFATQLRSNRLTRDKVVGPRPLTDWISFVGVCEGMTTDSVTCATQVELGFTDAEQGNSEKISVNFVELEGASDAMLMGFPTLTDLGYALDRDDDGHVWVSLRKLGVTLLAEMPSDEDKAFSCAVRATEPRVLVGPCVEMVDVYCEPTSGPLWITDDAVPGVRVVEGPVQEGPGKVMLALDPGARLTISGARVPWTTTRPTVEGLARAQAAAELTAQYSRAEAKRHGGPSRLVT